MQAIATCLIVAVLALITSLSIRASVRKNLKASRLYLKYENMDDYIRRIRPDLYKISKFSDYTMFVCFLLFIISLVKLILLGG
jgi:hypothetical protein